MRSVVGNPIFPRRADALLTRDERAELIWILISIPLAGDLNLGTGGVRKLRFGASGRGKRAAMPVVAVILY